MTQYLVFGGAAAYLFVMDLWLNRGQTMTLTRAGSWSIMYVLAALLFGLFILGTRGVDDMQLFYTAYALEKVLSVDNLIVFSAVFTYFGIRPEHRHRILHWGIIGAAAMRLIFVYAGTAMFARMEVAMSLVFAALIAYAGYAVLRGSNEQVVDHSNRWYVRWLSKVRPVYTGPGADSKFFIQCLNVPDPADGYKPWDRRWDPGMYWCITPALLCLVSIEITDVVFAVDSVPVVIAVARDPYIVYTSMIFAIMGLRAMYFILDALQRMLRYMNIAVGAVLFFVAGKLVLQALGVHMPPVWSLGVVGVMLTGGVAASLLGRKNEPA